MPRPTPPPGKEHTNVSISLPRDIAEEFYAAAGEGYGSRTDLFRRMFRAWQKDANLRALLEEERRRRRTADAIVQRMREALYAA